MKPLSEDAIQKLDQMITTLEPVIGFLRQKVRDKVINGQIDIQRIDRLVLAYDDFISASHED
jgi:cytochrome c-type biogenesis protein CcmH/NrfF